MRSKARRQTTGIGHQAVPLARGRPDQQADALKFNPSCPIPKRKRMRERNYSSLNCLVLFLSSSPCPTLRPVLFHDLTVPGHPRPGAALAGVALRPVLPEPRRWGCRRRWKTCALVGHSAACMPRCFRGQLLHVASLMRYPSKR